MKNYQKYQKSYFMPPESCLDWAKKDAIGRAPVWCSVDLRDGNQALVTPMSLDQKIEFFEYLVKVGFKEIEVGFPAASETEYDFLRALIERGLIPDDVRIQVLTQSRAHIIKKTYEALAGCKNAVVHLYNSTSVAQREQVFKKPKSEIVKIAVEGAELVKKYAAETPGNFKFEYSPESFTGTEMEFALEICNAVLDVWKPSADNPVIINLPSTVQCSMPHVYASQVEYMSKHLHYRDAVVVSVHPHNDRGSAVSDAEMGILGGAQRVEGTLFGNGERTGNVDIVTLALNLFSQGVDPQLDLENLAEVREKYERLTGMRVHERHPYGGELVFTAFSGSHQDAIAKGMKCREQDPDGKWAVPYLLIDPKDVGRSYEADIIRINSQSGKGGIGYLLERNYGFSLPAKMREDFGYAVKSVSDHAHKELSPKEVLDIFVERYVNRKTPVEFVECHYKQQGGGIEATLTVRENGAERVLTASGNGRLDAVSNAVKAGLGVTYDNLTYEEHALNHGSNAEAAAYVGITAPNCTLVWGAGVDSDIINASVRALLSAVNRM